MPIDGNGDMKFATENQNIKFNYVLFKYRAKKLQWNLHIWTIYLAFYWYQNIYNTLDIIAKN